MPLSVDVEDITIIVGIGKLHLDIIVERLKKYEIINIGILRKMKKVLYFIPNCILVLIDLICRPLINHMYIWWGKDHEYWVIHDYAGIILLAISICCIALRIIFNAKRCNIISKTYKIINNILTILLLIVMFFLYGSTALA